MIGLWILSVLLIAAGIPLILGRVPRNDLYGLRTPASMEGSEEEWYRLNRRAGYGLLVIGIATLVVSLLLVFLRR